MKILGECFEIGINFFQGIMATYFSYSFLGDKKGRSYIKSHGLIFAWVFMIVISLFNNSAVFEHFYSVFYVLLLILYEFMSLKGNISRKIFSSVYPITVMFVASLGVLSVTALIYRESVSSVLEYEGLRRVVSVILVQLVIFYILNISLKLFHKDDSLNKKEWLFISFVLVFSMIIGIILLLAAISSENIISIIYISIGIISLAVVNIMSVYFIIDISRKNKELMENEILKARMEYYSQYVKNADTEYQLIRKIRHDMNDLHNVVADLIRQGKGQQAVEYLKKMNENLFEKKIYLKTENEIVNSVINAKLSVACSLGIEVTCISIEKFENIDDIDLCRLLSNMLENAVSALRDDMAENRSIELKISENSDMIFFVLKNSISSSVIEKNPDLLTTKNDKEDHGFGTKIICDIAEKYNGKCDFYEKNNMFYCLVVLSKKNLR